MAYIRNVATPDDLRRASYSGTGRAPYEENRLKSVLRMLASGAQGLGAVPPGANFGTAFLAAAGGGAQAASAAQRTAQEYATRQEENRLKHQDDELQRRYTEALIKKAEKPEKVERTLSTELQELRDALGREPTEKEKQIKLGIYKEPPAGREPRVNPRSRIAEAEAALGRKLTEEEKLVLVGIDPKQGDPKTPQFIGEQVRLINMMNPNDKEDRETLQRILKNPPSREEFEAAKAKLMVRPGAYRR